MDTERFVFEKVNMGRGDERYIGLADGSLGTTVRKDAESIADQILWQLADDAIKQANNQGNRTNPRSGFASG